MWSIVLNFEKDRFIFYFISYAHEKNRFEKNALKVLSIKNLNKFRLTFNLLLQF